MPREELQILFNNSSNYCDILRHFNLNPYSGNHKTLKKRLEYDNIDLSIFNNNQKNMIKQKTINEALELKDIFKKNSSFNNSSLRRKIIKLSLLPYKCCECGCNGEWMGKKLSLQLDHINGINNDHRLNNLRFLCPNCHSQTKTYSGKNKPSKFCKMCNEIEVKRKSKYCKKCKELRLSKTCNKKKFDPSKKELIEKIKEFNVNIVQIGKFYGVSDNAIRKRCKKLNIDWKNL